VRSMTIGTRRDGGAFVSPLRLARLQLLCVAMHVGVPRSPGRACSGSRFKPADLFSRRRRNNGCWFGSSLALDATTQKRRSSHGLIAR